MNETKVKLGVSPVMIVGCVFAPMGLLFLVVGLTLGIGLHLPEFILMFGLMGTIFLVLGLVFLLRPLVKKKKLQAVVDANRYFWGEVADVETVYSVRVNGRCPIRLLVKMTDPQGNIHVFKSRNIFLPYVPDLLGKQVKVYAEQGNLNNYYVDADPIFSNIVTH